MPLVTVKLGAGRPAEIKRNIAKELAGVMVKTLDVKPEWVTSSSRNWEKRIGPQEGDCTAKIPERVLKNPGHKLRRPS